MSALDSYITEYLEYCQYRRRLGKASKSCRVDLKQYTLFI